MLAECIPADSLALAKQAALILQWPLQHGFPFATVELVDSSHCPQLADLRLRPGDAWVWGRVKRLGNGKTKERLLAHMSLIQPGAPVAIRDLERARRRLARSGWFSEVGKAQLFRARNRNQLYPAFWIEEADQSSAEGWIQYQNQPQSQDDAPWSGKILVDLQNIAGTGRVLRIAGESGNQERSAEFNYREPYPLDFPIWMAFSGGLWQQDTLAEQAWGTADFTLPLDFEWSLVLGGGVSWDREGDLQSETRWGRIGISRDGRDRLPFPRSGWLWSTDWKAGQRKTDSSQTFARAQSTLGVWYPLWSSFGWVNLWQAEGLWPRQARYLESEWISLGGDILSGYWPGSLKTTAYGYWNTSVQWSWKRSQALLFLESARIRSRLGNGQETRHSYGLSWNQDVAGAGLGIKLGWSEEAELGEALLSVRVLTRF